MLMLLVMTNGWMVVISGIAGCSKSQQLRGEREEETLSLLPAVIIKTRDKLTVADCPCFTVREEES